MQARLIRWWLSANLLGGSLALGANPIEDIQLTVYRDTYDDVGLVMVNETRTVEVPAGLSVLTFEGVAEQIVPQTASLSGLDATIVESNFDYDLLAPGPLIEKSLGKRVALVRTDAATGSVTQSHGTLISGPAGVLVRTEAGVEALGCSGAIERLTIETLPSGLHPNPTLSVRIDAPRASKQTIQLSYLSLGMSWRADYTARIHPNGKRLDLAAWLTIDNQLGNTFTDAKASVVAGDLAREAETLPPEIATRAMQTRCWPIGVFARQIPVQRLRAFRRQAYPVAMDFRTSAVEEIALTGAMTAEASELDEYKLYTVPRRTSLPPRQKKQVRLLDQKKVRFTRRYRYDVHGHILRQAPALAKPEVIIVLQNRARAGLGVPLPAGTVAVFEQIDGRAIFTGEDTINDIPLNEKAEIATGLANDIWIRPRIVSDQQDGRGEVLIIEIEVTNGKSSTVNLEFRHHPDYPSAKIVAETLPHRLVDGIIQWDMKLSRGKRRVLRYTVEERY